MLKFEGEFLVENRWEPGEMLKIDTEKNCFNVRLGKSTLVQFQDKIVINVQDISKLPNENNVFTINDQVEFFNGKSWIMGEIKAKSGKFYSIIFKGKDDAFNSELIYVTQIRAVTNLNDAIILDLNLCSPFSLSRFNALKSHKKCINKLVEKIRKIFSKDEINFVFANESDLYVFGNVDNELIESIILNSFEHFEKIEKENDKLLSSLKSNSKNEKEFRDSITIEKSLYDSQRSKIKALGVKAEIKNTKVPNEIFISLKSKTQKALKEAMDILSMRSIYLDVPIDDTDEFFTEESDNKNLKYYEKLYELSSCNHFKHDDNSSTIRAVGKKENIEYFKATIEQYFKSKELKKEKEKEVSDLKSQILKLS